MYAPPDVGNLEKVPSLLRPAACARFMVEPAPFLPGPSAPLVTAQLSSRPVSPVAQHLLVPVQFSTAPRPSGSECHFDPGDPAIAIAASRLGLVLRGGYASELVDPHRS